MNKIKLLEELIKAFELTPNEVVRYWQETGRIQPALFSRSRAKTKKRSKQTGESKRKAARKNLLCMAEGDIFEALKKVIAEQAGIEEEDVMRGSNLVSLGIDSLDIAEITMAVEKMFGISIPDEELYDKETVQDILDYLVERKVMINGGMPIIS